MGFVVGIILFAIAIYTYVKKRNIVHPCCLMCLVWGAISFLGAFRFFGLYDTSKKTWWIILVGVLAYALGCLLSEFGKKEEKYEGIPLKEKELYLWSARTHHLLFLLVVAIQIVPAVNSLRLIIKGADLSWIRAAYYGMMPLEGYFSTIIPGVFGDIVRHAQTLLTLLLQAVCFVAFIDKKKIYYLLEVVMLNGCLILIDGGRSILLFCIIDLVVSFLCLMRKAKKEKRKISSALKWGVAAAFSVVAFAVVGMSLLRGSEIKKIFYGFYMYACGSLVLSDLHIARVVETGSRIGINSYFYGFMALLSPIFDAFEIAKPQWFLDALRYVMKAHRILSISDEKTSNAMLTCFYYLYADFRWIGLVVGMALFGFFMGKLYNSFDKTGKLYFLVFYAVWCHTFWTCIQTYPLIGAENCTLLVFMIVFCCCERKKDRYFIQKGNYGNRTHHLRRYWRKQEMLGGSWRQTVKEIIL